MVKILISAAAFQAIAATLPGNVAVEPERAPGGGCGGAGVDVSRDTSTLDLLACIAAAVPLLARGFLLQGLAAIRLRH
jgi:hypothetical protein